MTMKWHFTRVTGPHPVQRCVVGMVVALMMMSVEARPFVDQADIDLASQSTSLRLFGSEFEAAGDRKLFTRDLALGEQSAREFSLKSFVKLTHQKPPIYGRDFLFDFDAFERELFASLSLVAMSSHSEDAEAAWLDTVTSNVVVVETTPSSRASIPAPTTLMLVTVGILGLILHRRRTNWTEH